MHLKFFTNFSKLHRFSTAKMHHKAEAAAIILLNLAGWIMNMKATANKKKNNPLKLDRAW